jgi:surface protein
LGSTVPGCVVAFNEPLGRWNTSRVANMEGMFGGMSVFNRPLGSWNTRKVGDMPGMFSGVRLSISNYNQLLFGWSRQLHLMRVRLDAGSSRYTGAAVAARRRFIARWGWRITGGGYTAAMAVSQTTLLPRVGPVRLPSALTSAGVRGGAVNTPARFVLARSPMRPGAGWDTVRVVVRPTDSVHSNEDDCRASPRLPPHTSG